MNKPPAPTEIWVSFNWSGTICCTSTTEPNDLLDDGYGHKWVKMINESQFCDCSIKKGLN